MKRTEEEMAFNYGEALLAFNHFYYGYRCEERMMGKKLKDDLFMGFKNMGIFFWDSLDIWCYEMDVY